MKISKIIALAITLLLTSQVALAQTTCGATWVGPFTPAQGNALCTAKMLNFGSAIGWIGSNSIDSADSKRVCVTANGGMSASAARGSSLCVNGNENANTGGLNLTTGNTATSDAFVDLAGSDSDFTVRNTSNAIMFKIFQGNEVALPLSGGTISLQEGTAASACMGAATPNGNNAVAVSTTCALTGARVFYSRAGAITNMGTITTTTAPSGTGFSFASTGASDATASSVIWMIVKEAA